LDYPNNFDIPSYPAGKTVAFSRRVAVWIAIIFFLIIVACGFVLFGIKIKKNYPFLVSIDPFTDEWTVIAYPDQSKEKIPQYQIIQEKLVHDYVENWFTISGDTKKNEMRWDDCSIEDCKDASQFNPKNIDCAIACRSSTTLFETFLSNVLPEYQARVDTASETWRVERVLITPNRIGETAGRWQFFATILSNINGQFNVLGFVKINRNIDNYPANLGYYVEDFNAYRIANE